MGGPYGDAIGGIIPACAGSTDLASSCKLFEWDHPRMRGEHMAAPFWMPLMRGSSPHARGALPRIQALKLHRGIIPACAGSTARFFRSSMNTWDHPRMRGEHSTLISTARSNRGSSPHTRGARRAPNRRYQTVRIIPAYAGSTTSKARMSAASRDHPRIRGEHSTRRSRLTRLRGSSPHTRGAHAGEEPQPVK